jgi:hypothetical protein
VSTAVELWHRVHHVLLAASPTYLAACSIAGDDHSGGDESYSSDATVDDLELPPACLPAALPPTLRGRSMTLGEEIKVVDWDGSIGGIQQSDDSTDSAHAEDELPVPSSPPASALARALTRRRR